MTTPLPSHECRFLRATGQPCGVETYGAPMCRYHADVFCAVCLEPATHAEATGDVCWHYCKDHRGKKSDTPERVPAAS